MPKSRAARLAFALSVCLCLLVIGRNMYRRYMQKSILDAIARHDVAGVRSLLRWGADPNGKLSLVVKDWPQDQDNEEVRASNDAIACLFIRQGASLRPEQAGFPYLHAACRNSSVEVVRCLLERGADPKESDINGATPLSTAVNASIVSKIKYNFVNTASMDYKIEEGASARRRKAALQIILMLRAKGAQYTLWEAATMGDTEAIKAALDAETPVDALKPHYTYHNTALVQAVEYGHIEAVKLLLARGANPNLLVNDTLPLSVAIQTGNREMVDWLLAHGANVNPKEAKEYESPLIDAVQCMPALVPTLLARGAEVNVCDQRGLSPLWAAVAKRQLDTVQILLRHGARVGASDRPLPVSTHNPPDTPHSVGAVASAPALPSTPVTKTTPSSVLEEAVDHFPECLETLLKAGGNSSPDRLDLLLTAAKCGRAGLFDRLLEIGADPNAIGAMGETPLIVAITRAPAGVKTLLEHGANANTLDKFQSTPLTIAVIAGNGEAVRLLLAHGANVNAHPPRGHAALYSARKKKNAAIIALLEKAGATDDR